MKLIYTTPEAEVILIRPTFSVLQTSGGSGGQGMHEEEDNGWGGN